MTWMGKKHPLKHLGTLHGRGILAPSTGGDAFGPVRYEIDGYLDRGQRTGSGEVEGEAALLARAFVAGDLVLLLEKGGRLAVRLGDPEGEAVTTLIAPDSFPE